jgi:hypothetical protein
LLKYSKDLRDSNNLYHWVLRENTFERNMGEGLDIMLPYVWQYNENYTHTVHLVRNLKLSFYPGFKLIIFLDWFRSAFIFSPFCKEEKIV